MNTDPTRFVRGAAALLVALAALLADALAQVPLEPSADEVKAAYVHKLPGYVDWPAAAFADAASPIVVGVLGADAVATALSSIASARPLQGRPMVVKRIGRVDTRDGLHLLYVGRSGWDAAARLLAARKSQPVLVVADTPGALSRGAMVNFVIVDGRVRFEIAPAAAEEIGLKLSSRLLAVAERVLRAAP